MELDGVDSTGVSQEVIHFVHRELRDWRRSEEEEEDNRERRQHRWFYKRYVMRIGGGATDGMVINQRDAVYCVDCLRALLLNIEARKIVLLFSGKRINHEALRVFCHFLQQPTCSLSALALVSLPPDQLSRLLASLHNNTSVKELAVSMSEEDGVLVNDERLRISELLQSKKDFQHLRFRGDGFKNCISDVCRGLRHGLPCLQTLGLNGSNIGDEGTRQVLEAIKDADFPALNDLDFHYINLTSVGLRYLTEFLPIALPRIQILNLNGNRAAFRDQESTRRFGKNILSSTVMIVKELCVTDCGEHTPTIIKACESEHCKVEVLDISCIDIFTQTQLQAHHERHQQIVCEQLIESLPNIKTVRQLWCSCQALGEGDDNRRRLAMKALYRNMSIVELMVRYSPLLDRNQDLREIGRLKAPILRRNQLLTKIDGLLRPPLPPPPPPPVAANQSSSSPTAVIPAPWLGIWSRVLTTVGQPQSDGGGGPTPVFKVLQDRLATWVTDQNSKKRKRDNDA